MQTKSNTNRIRKAAKRNESNLLLLLLLLLLLQLLFTFALCLSCDNLAASREHHIMTLVVAPSLCLCLVVIFLPILCSIFICCSCSSARYYLNNAGQCCVKKKESHSISFSFSHKKNTWPFTESRLMFNHGC